jgi:serine/threonine protein kinase
MARGGFAGMTLKLTAQSFLQGVRQSGLVATEEVDTFLGAYKETGGDATNPTALAQAFVNKKLLTGWQAEQLLQGRCRGFLLGRYKLLSLLGTGENSAVFLARHTGLDRLAAIKILPAHRVKDTSYLGRFYREAKAVASLNHPNIVRAYDVDSQKNDDTELHYLVLEYIEGTNLEKLIIKEGRISPSAAVDAIRQATMGLAHAHEAGLVHRDVKPSNILIGNDGTVKLLDLGLARFFRDEEEESLTLKHDEKVLGTADYLSPEQAIDSHGVDHRADIYSLGCTLFYVLTGKPPFSDGTLVQRMLAHQTRPVPQLAESREDLAPGLQPILEKMMAKKPADRYQSSTDIVDELTVWLLKNGDDAWRKKNRQLAAAASLGNDSPAPRPATPAATATDSAKLAQRPGTASGKLPKNQPNRPAANPGNGSAQQKAGQPAQRVEQKNPAKPAAVVAPAAKPAATASPKPAVPLSVMKAGGQPPEWLMPALVAMGLSLIFLLTIFWVARSWRPSATTTVQETPRTATGVN